MALAMSLTPRRERGRPREFDLNQALDDAMLVFRRQGFHGASITDLSAAMQLTAGSIYKAFGDKHGLFLQVFERYLQLRHQALRHALENQPDGRSAIKQLLQFYFDSSRDLQGRLGCMVVNSTVEQNLLEEPLAQRVREVVLGNRTRLVQLIEQGQQDGSVNPDINAQAGAEMLLCVLFGMRVMAKNSNLQHEEQSLALILKMLD